MLTKNEIKKIKSLQKKKYRHEYQKFIVEGFKSVKELINSHIKVESVIASSQIDLRQIHFPNITIVKPSTFNTLSTQKTASGILAIANIPKYSLNTKKLGKITLILDQITDPGNLGTIIRTCDWFGISNIICSTNTVDIYNPKVIQSTMGSFTRVNIFYTDLKQLLLKEKDNCKILGLDMVGTPIQDFKVDEQKIFLIVGNEANGLSQEIRDIINHTISIPPAISSNNKQQPESLNASIAVAISCYELSKTIHF